MNWNQLEIGKRYGFKRPMVWVPPNEAAVEGRWVVPSYREEPDPATAAASITLTAKRQTIRERHQATRQVMGTMWTVDGIQVGNLPWEDDGNIEGFWEVLQEEKERVAERERVHRERTRIRGEAITEIMSGLTALGIKSGNTHWGVTIGDRQSADEGDPDSLNKLLALVKVAMIADVVTVS